MKARPEPSFSSGHGYRTAPEAPKSRSKRDLCGPLPLPNGTHAGHPIPRPPRPSAASLTSRKLHGSPSGLQLPPVRWRHPSGSHRYGGATHQATHPAPRLHARAFTPAPSRPRLHARAFTPAPSRRAPRLRLRAAPRPPALVPLRARAPRDTNALLSRRRSVSPFGPGQMVCAQIICPHIIILKRGSPRCGNTNTRWRRP